MLRVGLLLFVSLMTFNLGSVSVKAAGSAKSPYTLFELSCSKNQRATGCAAPFRQCDLGVDRDIVQTCQYSAKKQRCPDFTWEKCCATNCFLRAGKTMKGTQACMEECGDSAGSRVYWPKAKKKTKFN